ncbi:MAG: Tm-1-like ATP-binding domain-containing protein [Anaerolineae bacterium]|nr:Tm-1-like ATP-binding domain-containing protein [Anaerolineae bacterium]NUQ02942.1 Tm-1-like ATP-binding domain-containing protein [Anaerolineae bacterium]
MPTVLLIGTLDTKGPETAFLRDRVRAFGCETLVLDSGILGEAQGITADFPREVVAHAAGSDIDSLRNAGTRGKAVEEMLKGVRTIALDLFQAGRIHGAAALGGAEGSVLAAAAMKVLPVGFPKLIVSPIASGHRKFAPFVGTKDVLVMHSVVDILGLNAVSMPIFDSAAAAIAGMAKAYVDRPESMAHPAGRRSLAATMLGNTTRPLMRIRPQIEAEGCDFVIFHANGVGGAAMEALIDGGAFSAVLDYTLSEVAGFIAGGFHNGGPTRMDAALRAGLPQVIVPGCLDFMVFGARHEVPEQFHDRLMYYHNPEFTLVRLTLEEQLKAVDFVVEKLNQATAPVRMLVPLRGISVMDNAGGGTFWDAEWDRRRRERLRSGLRGDIVYEEIDAHINDDAFADAALDALQGILKG